MTGNYGVYADFGLGPVDIHQHKFLNAGVRCWAIYAGENLLGAVIDLSTRGGTGWGFTSTSEINQLGAQDCTASGPYGRRGIAAVALVERHGGRMIPAYLVESAELPIEDPAIDTTPVLSESGLGLFSAGGTGGGGI